jgi:hypothetical protein
MRVRFNDVDEFVKDLERDALGVANMRARLTTMETRSQSVRCVWVIAGAKVLSGVPGHDDYDLVEYRRHVGDLWGHPDDSLVAERANAIVAELREGLEQSGFVVAGGMYEEVR